MADAAALVTTIAEGLAAQIENDVAAAAREPAQADHQKTYTFDLTGDDATQFKALSSPNDSAKAAEALVVERFGIPINFFREVLQSNIEILPQQSTRQKPWESIDSVTILLRDVPVKTLAEHRKRAAGIAEGNPVDGTIIGRLRTNLNMTEGDPSLSIDLSDHRTDPRGSLVSPEMLAAALRVELNTRLGGGVEIRMNASSPAEMSAMTTGGGCPYPVKDLTVTAPRQIIERARADGRNKT